MPVKNETAKSPRLQTPSFYRAAHRNSILYSQRWRRIHAAPLKTGIQEKTVQLISLKLSELLSIKSRKHTSGRQTLRRQHLEHPDHDVPQLLAVRRQVTPNRSLELLVPCIAEHHAGILCRHAARAHPVRNAPKRPHIHSGGVVPLPALGRNVVQRPRPRRHVALLHLLRQPKVRQHHLRPVRPQQQVLRLQVAVHDRRRQRVHVHQRRAALTQHNVQHHRLRDPVAARVRLLDVPCQVPFRAVVHHDAHVAWCDLEQRCSR
mmetsp:Transcript_68243/g.79430  ORF Transcript_68243/g.79430 Transcript_68243/m.79430 type:complete len:262 (+) Transcript_68243:42-827(+)